VLSCVPVSFVNYSACKRVCENINKMLLCIINDKFNLAEMLLLHFYARQNGQLPALIADEIFIEYIQYINNLLAC
jgi:hypothetical protein